MSKKIADKKLIGYIVPQWEIPDDAYKARNFWVMVDCWHRFAKNQQERENNISEGCQDG